MVKRKDEVVRDTTKGIEFLMKKNKITVFTGHGSFVTANKIAIKKADGSVESVQGVAKVVSGSENAKLKVSFFRPFYGNYWVLALGEQYDWVLVGEPGREFGWVLSRSPQINAASLSAALDKAVQLGYARDQFKVSLQTQPLQP